MRTWIAPALILALLLGTNAGAAVPIYSGYLQVATGASITDPNNAGTPTCVGITALNVYVYGLNCVQNVSVGAGLVNTGTALNPIIALSGTAGVTSITCAGNISCVSSSTPTITEVASPSWTNGTFAGNVTLNTTAGSLHLGGTGSIFFDQGTASAGQIGVPGSGTTVQGVQCTIFGAANNGVGYRWCVDTSGNVGANGNVTAANFFNGSRRAWKAKIAPVDGLALVNATDVKQYTCMNPRCGPLGERKVGIIADDSPSAIAGPQHDHYDGFALAAADARAIQQLQAQVRALAAQVARLQRK